MAGRGSRFFLERHRNPEYAKPKPLINIAGKPMVEWALSSLPRREVDQLIFLVLRDHVESSQIDASLRKMFGEDTKIIVVDKVTEGAACTVLLAKEYINNEEPLIIIDSDTYFDGKRLFDDLHLHGANIDGAIPVFYANNSKWSFSKVDNEGLLIETAEKIKISRNAHVGTYYFSKGRDFVWAAEEMIEENDRTNNEFYTAPVYNYLVRRGKKIILSRPRFIFGLGTPNDLDKFKEFLRRGEVTHNFNGLSI